MDPYHQASLLLTSLEAIHPWKYLCALIERNTAVHPHDWGIPYVVCRAVGGNPDNGIPPMAAIAALQMGILLIDDILDDDPRGEYRVVGSGAAANMASALLTAGMSVIRQSHLKESHQLPMLDALHAMSLSTAVGQQWDSENPRDEAGYWRVVRQKSVPFYATAFYLGAVAGEATPHDATTLQEIGGLYGEMIQISDDLGDALAVPAAPDWLQCRASLPLLFAELVAHPERDRFLELRGAIDTTSALEEAQAILVRCGAVSYALDELIQRNHLARQKIDALSLRHPAFVINLFDRLIAPIYDLFATLETPVTE